jgi:uncharacterized membrane protein
MHVRADRAPWAVTSMYAGGAIAAGILLPRIESRVFPDLISPVSVAAATAIYSSIASGMIALTGVVFSLTFVMVQFSATAYSPRLVLWFARDPLLAHAFGTFTATFLYAIAALAWIDRAGTPGRVPLVSALAVVALLLASTAMFVGLIQRIGALQISRTLAFTGDQGRRVIDSTYRTASVPLLEASSQTFPDVRSVETLVYHGPPVAVQGIAITTLADLATQADALVEVVVAVGDTIAESTPMVRIINARTPPDERRIRRCVVLGVERTFDQDPKYALRMLVDIAIRALSPAINDPTTAVQALDQIGDLLLRLGRCQLEVGAVQDARGKLRVIVPFPTWDDLLRLAFGEIAVYGATSVQVMRRMLALIADLDAAVPSERRSALGEWHAHLRRSVTANFPDAEYRSAALSEDRQGLGVTRRAGDASLRR